MRDLGIDVDILTLYYPKLPTKAIGHRRSFIYNNSSGVLIQMVQIFRASESDEIGKKGYTARYVADVKFRKNLDSGGFILVTVAAGTRTEPHKHSELEEVFVILTELKMHIDSTVFDLEKGDIVLVAPNESHSFEASAHSPADIIAIKFPNLKSDRISMDNH